MIAGGINGIVSIVSSHILRNNSSLIKKQVLKSDSIILTVLKSDFLK